eukprot:7377230-Prymnesium_polylepis.1
MSSLISLFICEDVACDVLTLAPYPGVIRSGEAQERVVVVAPMLFPQPRGLHESATDGVSTAASLPVGEAPPSDCNRFVPKHKRGEIDPPSELRFVDQVHVCEQEIDPILTCVAHHRDQQVDQHDWDEQDRGEVEHKEDHTRSDAAATSAAIVLHHPLRRKDRTFLVPPEGTTTAAAVRQHLPAVVAHKHTISVAHSVCGRADAARARHA